MNIKQFKIIALMALLIMSALVITPLGLTQSANAQPPNILYQAPITIYNNQSSATPNPYQQKLLINESLYSGYITYSGSLANFEFSYANNTIIPSWISLNNSGILSIWLNLTSIPATSQLTIYIDFASLTTNLLSNSGTTGIGEAPELSSTYAQYDNGASVFNFYDNFKGTTLSSVWTVPSGSTYSVNNGFIGTPNNYTSVYNPNIQETSSIIAEWGLNMSSTTYPNSASQFQLNRYSTSSNIHWLGVSGSDTLKNGANQVTTVSISSTGIQTFGIWNNGTTVTWYYEGSSYTYNSATSATDYLALGWAYGGQSNNFPTEYWVFTRAYPPNGVMPSVSYGAILFYTVTFNESGLPSNTLWNVSIYNNVYSTNTTSLNLTLSNGTYSYIAQSINYPSIYGNVTVNGANITTNLVFSIPLYNVQFDESGLPSGTLWQISLNGSQYYNTTNPVSITFSVSNGTYSYTALANNFYNPIYGNVTVNGANITVPITFTLANTYNVQIIETGLPSGTLWNTTVITVEGNFTNSTNTTSMNFTLPNGTYNYLEFMPNSFYSNMTGNFTVNGVNTTVYINNIIYNVTFLESGLPSGTAWNIYLNSSTINLVEESTNTTSIIYSLGNGNYTYLMTQNNTSVFLLKYYDGTDVLYVIQNGSFTVNNSNLTIYLNFTLYSVYYNISNPSNITFNIEIYNTTKSVLFNTNTSFIEYMPNGTYNDIFSANGNYTVIGFINPFTVNGANLTFNISLFTYNLEFNLSGLPLGDSITINVYNTNNGTLMFNTTTSQNVYVFLPNAPYNYTLSVSDINYTASGNPTTFTINNNLIIVNVSIYYDVLTIQESELSVGVNYYFELIYTNNATIISNLTLNSGIQTEYIWYNLPINVNLTVEAWYGISNNILYTSFYFTGNYTYNFNFLQGIIISGNSTVTVYEIGLPLNTLWYFYLFYVTGNTTLGNSSSYFSFITFFNVPNGIYNYTAYSQGYNIVNNEQNIEINNTTITINFISGTSTIGNNTTFTNPYNTTNNFNFSLSQWETIGYLGGSSVIMAVVGAFINPIGAFIVLGIEMLIGYELSIVDAWVLFFIGLAITMLIFYSRDVLTKSEE